MPTNENVSPGFFARLRARFGDFWWYSLIIFVSCRAGDVVQAFIGLWLVPRYVPQSELGAALPLGQAAGAIGLPLTILVIPFSRWLSIYAARGEMGKVKRLLQFAFASGAAAFAASILVARFVLPRFFDRMRLAEGSLGLLILCFGLVGPFSSVFSSALQGLKRFGAIAFANAAGAPLRLAVMLVAMPFRALSGYLLGQLAPPVLGIAVAWHSLRRHLGRGVAAVSPGRDEVRAMVRYTAPLALYVATGTILGAWQAMLFRQRLPEVESAAFYMISRLAETVTYAGATIGVVVFPMAAEAREKGASERALLRNIFLGTLAPGLAITLALALAGRPLLCAVPLWREYADYSGLMALFALRMTLLTAASVFFSCETAAGRFRYLFYWLPLALVETGALIALTGYGAFRGLLPDCAVDWMESLRAARLQFFVWWLLACSTAQMAAIAAHLAIRMRAGRRRAAAP